MANALLGASRPPLSEGRDIPFLFRLWCRQQFYRQRLLLGFTLLWIRHIVSILSCFTNGIFGCFPCLRPLGLRHFIPDVSTRRNNFRNPRKLLSYTPNRVAVDASAAIVRKDDRRNEVQVVHTVATVPRRRPVVAAAALIERGGSRGAPVEAAGERKVEGGLHSGGASGVIRNTVSVVEGLKFTRRATGGQTPTSRTEVVGGVISTRTPIVDIGASRGSSEVIEGAVFVAVEIRARDGDELRGSEGPGTFGLNPGVEGGGGDGAINVGVGAREVSSEGLRTEVQVTHPTFRSAISHVVFAHGVDLVVSVVIGFGGISNAKGGAIESLERRNLFCICRNSSISRAHSEGGGPSGG